MSLISDIDTYLELGIKEQYLQTWSNRSHQNELIIFYPVSDQTWYIAYVSMFPIGNETLNKHQRTISVYNTYWPMKLKSISLSRLYKLISGPVKSDGLRKIHKLMWRGCMYKHGFGMDDFQVYKCICRVPESIENEMEKLSSIHRFQVHLEVITIGGSIRVLPNVCLEISLSKNLKPMYSISFQW